MDSCSWLSFGRLNGSVRTRLAIIPEAPQRCEPKQKGPASSLAPHVPIVASLPLYIISSGRLAVAAFRVAHAAARHVVLDSPQTLPEPLGKLVPRAPQTGDRKSTRLNTSP